MSGKRVGWRPRACLVGKKEADDFEPLLAAVDVVTQEKVVSLWRESAILKEAEQIGVLAVHVACEIRTKRSGW